jgi:2-polyprenyl-3-methyl-5-hydroxy-6-metoxy-1,4-benzoquinol methylase
MNTIQCPVCDSDSATTLYPSVADYVTRDVFQVCQCNKCGVGFTYPQPNNLDKYYQKQYRKYVGIILLILKVMYGIRSRQWSRLFQQNGAALEIGCGDGYMLHSLKQEGWQVVGIERTPEMAEFARTNLGLEVYSSGIQEIPSQIQFDLIILFQVLEHIADPVAMLKELTHRLTQDGKLIIGVPNFGSWQRKFAGKTWFHLDIPRHLIHFSPESLEMALQQVGMTIKTIRYASLEHDPYGWIQSIFNRMFNDKNRLTRLLMRMDGLTLRTIVMVVSAIVLFLPAVFLSILSWVLGAGALMEVVAIKTNQ